VGAKNELANRGSCAYPPAQSDKKMTAGMSQRGRLRFAIGVVLIVSSYVFFGLMFVFGGLALRSQGGPWKFLALGAFALNWICFLLGLLLAGMEAVRLVRGRLSRIWKRKTDVCPADEKRAGGGT
jgi:hypothetical protein